ncbi:MAG: flagellar hook-length control protein FliK, partial [Pseudomonadota bacterium]
VDPATTSSTVVSVREQTVAVAPPRTNSAQTPHAENLDTESKPSKPIATFQEIDQEAGEDAALDQRKSDQRQENKDLQQRNVERQSIQNPSELPRPTTIRGSVQAQVLMGADATFQTSVSQQLASSTSPAVNREGIVDRAGATPMQSTPQADATPKTAAAQIAAALRNQPLLQKIELSLDPPELGRIEIQMEVAETGMRATLAAERPGTTDMIRRQAELLIQQFDEAGFSDVSLSFSDFGANADPDTDSGDEGWSGKDSQTIVTETPERLPRRMLATVGMDIRL